MRNGYSYAYIRANGFRALAESPCTVCCARVTMSLKAADGRSLAAGVWKERDMAGIVVGVDGSQDAHRALEWAVKEAAAHRAPLTVLAIHQVAVSAWTGSTITYPEDETLVEAARKGAEEAVAKAAAGVADRPAITVQAASGLPAQALIDASRDADLIVVGSRGSGGFRAVLGSVSNKVVHHAHCPVVVVPAAR